LKKVPVRYSVRPFLWMCSTCRPRWGAWRCPGR
jgi:hypothetical protein